MKTIQIEEDLYQYIASNTQEIGESASAILRRLLIEQQEKQVTAPVILAPLPGKDTFPANVEVNVQVDEAQNEKYSVESDAPAYVGSVFNLLNKEEIATQKGAVGRFLFILAALYRTHQTDFRKVLEIKGRERSYFALSAEEIEAKGSGVKSKQIPESEYWVNTNNNTPRKKYIITEAALALGYDGDQAEALRELI